MRPARDLCCGSEAESAADDTASARIFSAAAAEEHPRSFPRRDCPKAMNHIKLDRQNDARHPAIAPDEVAFRC